MPIPPGPDPADRLATPADPGTLLADPAISEDRPGLLIEGATAVIQAVTGQRIVEVADDEVTLDLDEHDHGLYLRLPERPVTAVTTVLIGATAVTDYVTQLRKARLWRADGWRSTLIAYP